MYCSLADRIPMNYSQPWQPLSAIFGAFGCWLTKAVPRLNAAHHPRIKRRIYAGSPLRQISGCADVLGIALYVKPGQTIHLITASQSEVVLQYTHSYSWELPAAGRFADETVPAIR